MIYLELQEIGFFEIFKGVILPLLLVFGVELAYRHMMLEISKSSIPEMQDDFEGADGLNALFETVIVMGSLKALLLVLSSSFMLLDKATSMYLWSTSFFIFYLANVLDSLYAEQRLYMLTSDVKTTLCYTGFGNPSEEVLMNWFVHVTLFMHVVDRNEQYFQRQPFLRRCVHFAWPVFGIAFLSIHMFALVALGANSYNQVLFGGTLGFTLAMVFHFWVKPFFIDLQARFTKKQIAETSMGDEVYEDRYMLKYKHLVIVVFFTLVLPLFIAYLVLDSFDDDVDDDFKSEVVLQKIWLGNDCPIDLDDASEILQYKHFICECTIVGLFGVWLGQFVEWFFLSNRGKINQSPWLWHLTADPRRTLARLAIAVAWLTAHLLPITLIDAQSFSMSNGASNFLTGLLYCFMLPAFALGFNTFAFLRFICFKLRVDNPNAAGKEFIPRQLLLEEEEKALAEQEEVELERRRQADKYMEGSVD